MMEISICTFEGERICTPINIEFYQDFDTDREIVRTAVIAFGEVVLGQTCGAMFSDECHQCGRRLVSQFDPPVWLCPHCDKFTSDKHRKLIREGVEE